MDRKGGLAVEVHSSHPKLGDPQDFVFFLQPPYSDAAVEKKKAEMIKAFVTVKQRMGYELRSPIAFRGPVGFFEHERIDLSDRHQGDDEFQLRGWFRRRRPLIVSADRIDQLHEMRRRAGLPVIQPTSKRSAEPLRSQSEAVVETTSNPFKSEE